jgi:hypothetical protein
MGQFKLIIFLTLIVIACALLKSIYPITEGFKQSNNLPLREFCIFGSTNTALTNGNRLVNLDQIQEVLKRGCRFIEIEIYSVSGMPVVGYSTDSKKYNLDSENSLALSDVLNKIVSVGFGEAPNSNEPILIHMRIKTSNRNLYNKIAHIIKTNIEPRMYSGARGNDAMLGTPLSRLMDKVVIVIDTDGEDSPDYQELKKYVHMESGQYSVRKYKVDELSAGLLEPPFVKDSGMTTDVKLIRIVYPSNTYNNPDITKMVPNFGAQIIANQFYSPDKNLSETERIFSDNKSAFVPISRMLRYLKNDASE